MTVKTPAPERAAGRRKLASEGKALPDKSFPIPNASYLKKAIRAVGRAAPGKRPALGRLIRKRARELGAWSTVKGSWADNTQSAKAMSSALRATLELAAANGEFVWELANQNGRVLDFVGPKGYVHGWKHVGSGGGVENDFKAASQMSKDELTRHLMNEHGGAPLPRTSRGTTRRARSSAQLVTHHEEMHKMLAAGSSHVNQGIGHSHGQRSSYANGHNGRALEFTGPKGYSHGWIYHGGPGLPKFAAGSRVKFPQSSGAHEGLVVRKEGEHLHVHVTKGAKTGQNIRIHAGMVTHYQHGTLQGHLEGERAKADSNSEGRRAATKRAKGATPQQLLNAEFTPTEKKVYAPSGLKVTAAHSRENEDRLKLIAHLTDVHGISHGHEGRSHQHLIEDHAADHESVISQRRGLANHGVGSRKHKSSTFSTLQTNDLIDRKARGEDTSEPVGYRGMTLTQLQGDPQYKALRASGMSHGGALDRMAAKKAIAERSSPEKVARANAPHPQTTQKPPPVASTQPKSQTKTPGGNTASVQTQGPGLTPGASDSATKSSALAKDMQGNSSVSPDHGALLKARTAARAQYPQGHPERLKAERAVRHSRKARRAGEGGSSGVATQRTAVAGTSRRRTSRTATPQAKEGTPFTGKSIAEHQAEVAQLKPHQKRAYDKAKLQGIGHERSMSVARSAAVPPKGTAGRAVRKAENKASKPERQASKHPTLKELLYKGRAQNAIAAEKQQGKDAALASRLGITVAKVAQLRQLAAALEARGWSQSEARKIAVGRIVHGTPIPQLAPGKKIARTSRA